MTVAAVLLPEPPASSPRRELPTRRRSAAGPSRASLVARAAAQAGLDETIAVVSSEADAASYPEEVTVLLDESSGGPSAALRCALDWCAREGHSGVVVSFGPGGGEHDVATDVAAWRTAARPAARPVAVLRAPRGSGGLLHLDPETWPLVPHEGPVQAMLQAHPNLVVEVQVDAGEGSPSGSGEKADDADRAAVAALIGRSPSGSFSVVVRDRSGGPVVIRNAPFLDDGTPMPTRYWLVGRRECELVGRLESTGGVRRAEAAVSPSLVAEAHRRYAAERDAAIPAGHPGPRPTGGVGGTRAGVKCLHAHLAWYLAGGGDPVGRWVVSELSGKLEGPVAAIDCGTNSTRLLVSASDGTTLDRQMIITRLGEGVDRTGLLAEGAIARTLDALRAYRVAMDRFGVVAARATATSAARDASNADAFFEAAEEVLGFRPELLAGVEEGRLSYAGATSGLPAADGPFLVVDLGGGSTELVAGVPVGAGGEVAAACSLDVGCVRITERMLHGDPPTTAEVAAAREFVRGLLDDAVTAYPALATPHAMVGVAGTVSTLVGLELGLDHYDRDRLHHQRISRSTVARLRDELLAETAARRRARPGIEEARADVIAGGALVLAEVMDRLGHDSLVYSESDILDGLVAGLLDTKARR